MRHERSVTMDSKEQTRNLIDNSGLEVLLPHYQSYVQKLVTAYKSGEHPVPPLALEDYAAEVFDRVTELDNALAGLRLTAGFVRELVSQPGSRPDIYRYHYENFLLRVIGFVDRTHRLVGTALMLNNRKFEGLGSNQFVKRQVQLQNDELLMSALEAVAQAAKRYRDTRNELIHASAFRTPELGLFLSAQYLGLVTDGIDVGELARQYFSRGSEEIMLTIAKLEALLTRLLDVLARYFSTAASQLA